MFFDEARFGTHSKIGHGWFLQGFRTGQKVNLGFKNFYVYSAIDPKTGDDLTLFMPKVNTDCMNLYLQELSLHLDEKQAIIVMDQAGWHKSKKLVVPQNIEIELLPPYSPELNPVERFWRYIKRHTIHNKCFTTIADIESSITTFLNTTSTDTIHNLCNIKYT